MEHISESAGTSRVGESTAPAYAIAVRATQGVGDYAEDFTTAVRRDVEDLLQGIYALAAAVAREAAESNTLAEQARARGLHAVPVFFHPALDSVLAWTQQTGIVGKELTEAALTEIFHRSLGTRAESQVHKDRADAVQVHSGLMTDLRWMKARTRFLRQYLSACETEGD